MSELDKFVAALRALGPQWRMVGDTLFLHLAEVDVDTGHLGLRGAQFYALPLTRPEITIVGWAPNGTDVRLYGDEVSVATFPMVIKPSGPDMADLVSRVAKAQINKDEIEPLVQRTVEILTRTGLMPAARIMQRLRPLLAGHDLSGRPALQDLATGSKHWPHLAVAGITFLAKIAAQRYHSELALLERQHTP